MQMVIALGGWITDALRSLAIVCQYQCDRPGEKVGAHMSDNIIELRRIS